MKDPFKLNVSSLMALYELFPTEEACIKHLEAINWHGKPVSPFDKTSKVYKHSQGRSHKDKTTVVGMIERDGFLVAKVTKDTTADTLSSLILAFVEPDTILFTDENASYNQIGRIYERYYVDHGKHQYGNGDITTNRIEGAWTVLKRMYHGTYINLPKKHLQKYVDEFVYRYNLRDISNSDRFNCFLCCADTRYTYKQMRESVCLK